MDKVESIFISHSHQDQVYVSELVGLLELANVPKIICSSYPGYHIPNDVDIYDYLKENLSKNCWFVCVLSENYYKSPACLNEMGASWILNKKYTAILTPNFKFTEIKGAINPHQLSFKMNDFIRLYEFLESTAEEFESGKLHAPTLTTRCQSSIEKINNYAEYEKRDRNTVLSYVEGVRTCPTDKTKLDVRFRLVNPLNIDVRVTLLKFVFIDENDKEYTHTENNVDIKLYRDENKVMVQSLDYGQSEYDPYFKKSQELIIKFEEDVW